MDRPKQDESIIGRDTDGSDPRAEIRDEELEAERIGPGDLEIEFELEEDGGEA